MSILRIVAFDLGSNMAIAHNLFDDGERVEHHEFKGKRVARAAATWLWLNDVFDGVKAAGGCEAVVYERPFVRGQDATRSLWGIAGLIEARAGVDGYRVVDYTPGEIKKWATGHGNADKEPMIEAARLTGYVGDNDHEADAWMLLRYAEVHTKPLPPKRVGRPKKRTV